MITACFRKIKHKNAILFSLFAFIIFASIMPVFAQEENRVNMHLHRIDTDLYPTNFMNISIIGSEGKLVEGLKEENFQVFENGKPQKVLKVVSSDQKGAPLEVVLVIDCSSSMTPAMDDTKKAACAFVDYLSPQDKVAVLSFSNIYYLNCDFTNDKEELKAAINKLQPNGGTSLYMTVSEAASMFSRKEEANRAVIALTDGRNNGPYTLENCVEDSRKHNVPIFTIGLGPDIDPDSLGLLANQTGGIYKNAPASSDLEEIYKMMATQLKKQYWVEYQASPEHWPKTSVNAMVRLKSVPGGSGLENSLIYYVPVQWWKLITFYILIELALIILTYFMFRLFWRRMGMNPVTATRIAIFALMFLTVVWYFFLFFRVVPLSWYLYFILIGIAQPLLLLIPVKIMAK
ncbi:MAG: VWA domain-containing protein [Firmicutes bacterium]|nr:VWA domain-containing protein [Bacillota bacterium]